MVEVTQEWIDERKRLLPEELLEMVRRQPGLPKSHYLNRKVADGGPRGLGEHKHEAMRELLRSGRLKRAPGRSLRAGVKGLYPADMELTSSSHWRSSADDDVIEEWLMGEVERNPGMGPTYYPRVPKAKGSPGGSQERKEVLLERLIAQGRLKLERLPKPQGRRTVGVFVAGGLPSAAG